MNNNISTIEILPNELFKDIFRYISTYDLFNSFYHLNFRFNSLVKSQDNLHLTLEEDWDHKQPIIPFYASYAKTLIVKHDEPIDFSYFSNIHSLKLCMPTAQQCNAILPHVLPHLKHLYISNLYYSNHTEQLCRLIFSSSFPHLQTCQIDQMTLSHFHSTSSLSLKQLTVSTCTWKTNMFPHIFNASPNLYYLRVTNFQTVAFELIPNSASIHMSVRCLFIHYSSIVEESFNQLDWILSTTPRLKTFILHINENEIDIEFLFVKLSYLMNQRAPYLTRFKAKIALNELSLLDLDNIKHLHPLFSNVKVHQNMHQNDNHLLILSNK